MTQHFDSLGLLDKFGDEQGATFSGAEVLAALTYKLEPGCDVPSSRDQASAAACGSLPVDACGVGAGDGVSGGQVKCSSSRGDLMLSVGCLAGCGDAATSDAAYAPSTNVLSSVRHWRAQQREAGRCAFFE